MGHGRWIAPLSTVRTTVPAPRRCSFLIICSSCSRRAERLQLRCTNPGAHLNSFATFLTYNVALQAKPRRSAAGWAAAVGAVAAGSRSEVRLLRQSWQSSQGYIQQGLRRITSSPHASSVQTLAAAGWPCHVSLTPQMLQSWTALARPIVFGQPMRKSGVDDDV